MTKEMINPESNLPTCHLFGCALPIRNICVVGGAAEFPGLRPRLEEEVAAELGAHHQFVHLQQKVSATNGQCNKRLGQQCNSCTMQQKAGRHVDRFVSRDMACLAAAAAVGGPAPGRGRRANRARARHGEEAALLSLLPPPFRCLALQRP